MPLNPEPVCSELSTVASDHYAAIRDHCPKCRGTGDRCLVERLRHLLEEAVAEVRH